MVTICIVLQTGLKILVTTTVSLYKRVPRQKNVFNEFRFEVKILRTFFECRSIVIFLTLNMFFLTG